MLIAVAVTALSQVENFGVLAGGIAVGALIGAVLAARVQMTSMPQLVAILHSFVGLAAVLVGFAITLDPVASHFDPSTSFGGALSLPKGAGTEAIIHRVETFIGIFVGAITFTGSV